MQERFVIGLPSCGDVGSAGGPAIGATASHVHGGTGSANLPNYNTDLGTTIQDPT